MKLLICGLVLCAVLASASETHKISHHAEKASKTMVDAEGFDWLLINAEIEATKSVEEQVFGNLGMKEPLASATPDLMQTVDAGTWEFDGIDETQYDADTLKELMDWANGAMAEVIDDTYAGDEVALLEVQTESKRRQSEEYLAEREAKAALPSEYNFFSAYPKCKTMGKNQKQCGSCWAFSLSTMMEHRLCREVHSLNKYNSSAIYPKNFALGPQALVSCYSGDKSVCPGVGGCNGGYMYSALKAIDTATKGVLFTEKVAPYTARNDPSSCTAFANKARNSKDRDALAFSVSNPLALTGKASRTISGKYDVEALKREIYDNGPMTVFIKTHPLFMGFSGDGVFSSPKTSTLTKQHSYHAMVVVGWKNVRHNGKLLPAWIIENSWGQAYPKMPWGSRHLLYILRGANTMEIETNTMLAARIKVKTASDRFRSEKSVSSGWPAYRCWKNGRQGVCMDKSKCYKNSYSGACPGSSSIQCCM